MLIFSLSLLGNDIAVDGTRILLLMGYKNAFTDFPNSLSETLKFMGHVVEVHDLKGLKIEYKSK
jgi:hypothetical protein